MTTLETILAWTQLTLVLPLAALGFHRGWMVALWAIHRRGRNDAPPAPPDDRLPRVTIQLPIYNERYVAARLCDAVRRIEWPRDRLQIQVLDDSTDDTTEIVTSRLRDMPPDLDVQHLRRANRRGFKAGALAAGLERASGEFLAVFDADFVPPPDFLRRTIPHFIDPDIGMVQARWEHLNADADRLTEVQATLLDGHFLVEHVARSRSGAMFNFNGTAGVFRRAAIDDAGGWQEDTLTEDLDLWDRAQLAGWRFRYLPDLACPADLPVDMNAFLNQQHRWAKGSIQTARKLLGRVVRSPRYGVLHKLEAVFHLCSNVAFPLLLGVFLIALPLNVLRYRSGSVLPPVLATIEGIPVLCATLCVLLYYGVAEWRAGRLTPWSLVRLPLVFGIGAGMCLSNTRAVLAAFGRNRGAFERTPKPVASAARDGSRIEYRSRRGRLPMLELALALWVAAASVAAFAASRHASGSFFALFAAGLFWAGGRSLREGLTNGVESPAFRLSGARP